MRERLSLGSGVSTSSCTKTWLERRVAEHVVPLVLSLNTLFSLIVPLPRMVARQGQSESELGHYLGFWDHIGIGPDSKDAQPCVSAQV
jgi:hypothetical protein